MITDIMLFDACHKVTLAIADSTLDVPEESHAFSADFERKLKRMIQQVEHPVRHRFAQIAASFLLVVFLGFGVTMAVSPTARAAVVGWVKETIGSWIGYHYVDEAARQQTFVDYHISALPEEYMEWQSSIVEDSYFGIFANEAGDTVMFTYSLTTAVSDVFVEYEDCTAIETQVAGMEATVFVPPDLSKGSTIIWFDEQTNTFFCISAVRSEEELVALAESVKQEE